MAYEVEVNVAKRGAAPVWVAMIGLHGKPVRTPTRSVAETIVQVDDRDPRDIRIVERD